MMPCMLDRLHQQIHDMFVVDRIMQARFFSSVFYKPQGLQYPELMGDGRLRQTHFFRNFVDGAFPFAEQRENLDPRRIPQGFENLRNGKQCFFVKDRNFFILSLFLYMNNYSYSILYANVGGLSKEMIRKKEQKLFHSQCKSFLSPSNFLISVTSWLTSKIPLYSPFSFLRA